MAISYPQQRPNFRTNDAFRTALSLLEKAKAWHIDHKLILWGEAVGLLLVYSFIFTYGSYTPFFGWIASIVAAILVGIFVYFISELLIVIGWMWAPAAVTAAAAGMLFLSDQGLDLGVGLLGMPAENWVKYVCLAPVLFYWAFASWHAARRSLDRRFPTFPALRPSQFGFRPWLRWPPRLLGISAHLFAAINLSLAVSGYVKSLVRPQDLSLDAAKAAPGPALVAPVAPTSLPDVALAIFVTWGPVIIIGMATIFIWAMDSTLSPSDDPKAESRRRSRTPVRRWSNPSFWLLALLITIGAFAAGSQVAAMPPGLFPATMAIFASAATYITAVSVSRIHGSVTTYENQLKHDRNRLFETAGVALIAVVGGIIYLTVLAHHPIWFGRNVGSMVTAFFAFGAIISIIDVFSLPLDYYLLKARKDPRVAELWNAPAGAPCFCGGCGCEAPAVARAPATNDYPDKTEVRFLLFAKQYASIFLQLKDAQLARRLQRFTFLIVCGLGILIAIGASQTRTYDGIRMCKDGGCLSSATSPADRPTIDQSVMAWYDQARADWEKRTTHSRDAPIPMIIVATAGGGIRAAYWTATILEDLRDTLSLRWIEQKESLHHYLFAISSVSGGSLGAAAYSATLLDTPPPENPKLTPPTDYLKADFLAPALASMFFHDVPANLIPFFPGSDRGVALEQTFEAASGGRLALPFLNFFPAVATFSYEAQAGQERSEGRKTWINADQWRPILLLNATHQKTGRRIIQSHVPIQKDVFQDAYDALSLYPSDTRMSTAVLDSARFLYISPPGHMPHGPKYEDRGYIIDGGYYENFGAQTALDLEEMVERVLAANNLSDKVRIIVLQISSDPSMRRSSRPRLLETGDQCRVSTAGLSGSRNFLPFEDGPTGLLTLRSRGDDEGPGVNFLNELFSPIAGVISTRESRGRAASEALAEHICPAPPQPRRGFFYHLAMCDPEPEDNETRIVPPLGWVLSTPSQGLIGDILYVCKNHDEMDHLVNAILGVAESR